MADNLRIAKIIDILDEKAVLLERMLGYTEEQAQAITEDDIEKLKSLVEKKGELIKKIDEIDRQFEAELTDAKTEFGIETLEQLPATETESIRELKEHTKNVLSLIERIKITEEENHSKAKRLLKVLGDRIKKINQGKKLNSAYGTRSGHPPYFLDKKK